MVGLFSPQKALPKKPLPTPGSRSSGEYMLQKEAEAEWFAEACVFLAHGQHFAD